MSLVLITGSTGLIGRHLVPLLLDRGHDVHLLVRDPDRHRGLLDGWGRGANLTVQRADLTDPDLELGVDPGAIDLVFHLAAIYDLDADEAALQAVNVDGTARLLSALDGLRGAFHHVSSIAVAGDFEGDFHEGLFDEGQGSLHAYHRTKFEAEALVRASGLDHRIHRPAAVVGHSETGATLRADGPYALFPVVKNLRRLLPSGMRVPVNLSTSVNMVPVDFVAAAIDALAAADLPGDARTFHLVDPAPPDFRETFDLIADAAGAPRSRTMGGTVRRLVPGMVDLLAGSASVGFLRSQAYQRLGVPQSIASAFNRDVTYGGAATAERLRSLGVECPPQDRYAPALWDFWARRLDPELDVDGPARLRFEGRRVLITGASSGVGRALALRLGEVGAHLILVARREDRLREVVAELPAGAAYYVVDLNDFDAVDRLVEDVLAEHGPVDVLVNNAARSIHRSGAESIERFHDFERVMRLNYFAPIRLIRGFLPGMRERGDGHVVNVLTAGVALPTPGFAAYASSKAALSHLTDTLAAELLADGVRFSGVHLPWVRTDMMGERFQDTRAMTPRKAADWIVDAVVKRRTHVKDGHATRRWIVNAAFPGFMTVMLSLMQKLYGDPAQFPEYAADRAVMRSLFPGNLL